MFSKHPAQTKVYVCRLSVKVYHSCLAEKEQSHGKDMVSLHKFQIPLLKHLVLQYISLTFNFPFHTLSHRLFYSPAVINNCCKWSFLSVQIKQRKALAQIFHILCVVFYSQSHLLFSALPELYTCFLLCSLHDEFITKRNISVHMIETQIFCSTEIKNKTNLSCHEIMKCLWQFYQST